ncbi:acyltransferase domain-containing protein [Pseudomarimonas arenosa]|uniref:Acyltransferase domain-containing protein n=1 Tax=Pseudomarimonas arenosa TaxID=2774145 RepID=A0AAW3ZIT4_9GAMM|nr:acyltransferase domain-containing protein [Pseudomarimonas arenosa]MBD8525901.1 acyltransferase domain-containing protein [Pseudomarimonas arenosa]
MRLPLVFMFSGQGSQYHQMGRELYDRHPRFRLWMDHCDEIAAPLIGGSLCDVLYRDGDKGQPFDRLLHTNPALVAFEFSLARVLIEAGASPDYLLGYSLGELTAAIVGEALSIEQGIGLAVDYARLIEAESPLATMLAVVDVPDIETRYADQFAGCWVTARNFDRHLVVTGPVDAIAPLREALARDGVVHQVLSVKYGFHTEMQQALEAPFMALARTLDFAPLRTPMVSCLDGRVYHGDSDPQDWLRRMWTTFRQPVEFASTVRSLLDRGDFHFLDVGPSGTLATFVKYLLPADSASTFNDVINPFGMDEQKYRGALQAIGLSDAASTADELGNVSYSARRAFV